MKVDVVVTRHQVAIPSNSGSLPSFGFQILIMIMIIVAIPSNSGSLPSAA